MPSRPSHCFYKIQIQNNHIRKVLIVLFCYLFLLIAACTEQNQVTIPPGDCRKYAELNYSNYDSLNSDPVSVIEGEIEGDDLV
jgi:hypothetical protein